MILVDTFSHPCPSSLLSSLPSPLPLLLPDSTVMMSGNSPFISKTARYNFLSRSGESYTVFPHSTSTVRLNSKHSSRTPLPPVVEPVEGYSSSSGFSSLPPSQFSPSSPSSSSASPPESSSSQPDSDSASSQEEREEARRSLGAKGSRVRGSKKGAKVQECQGCKEEGEKVTGLTREAEKLAGELASTRQTILRMHEREEKMKERLMDLRLKSEEQISITSSSCSSVYLSVPGKGRPVVREERKVTGSRREAARLVARYGELYSQARLDTLDALDELKELSSAEELKNKLLFSVVVVRLYCYNSL